MEGLIIKEFLDRYEKAVESMLYYKARVNRHEDDLRKCNKYIQELKSNIHLLEAKIDKLQKQE